MPSCCQSRVQDADAAPLEVFFQRRCNQIIKSQLKGEAGKGSKWPCAGGTETVKKNNLVLLKAKVRAVGNLHIFSWWEGDIL